MNIGNLEICNVPRIASVIYGKNVVDLAKLSAKEGADLLELRIDQLKNISKNSVVKTLEKIKNIIKLPIIVTIRSEKESDDSLNKYNYKLSQSERLNLYESTIPISDAVDIELSSDEINDKIIKIAHKHKKKVIISYHNFVETPSDLNLNAIINKSIKKQADITKIATYAQDRKDISRLMNLTSQFSTKQPMISISLGSIGTISRITAPLFGSCITYGYIGGTPAAKGQLDITELRNYLRLFYSDYNQV